MRRKRCSKCKRIKNINKFGKRSDSKDGLNAQCKKCRSKKSKSLKEKEKRRVYRANPKVKENGKVKRLERYRRYREKHQSEVRARLRIQYYKNKEAYKERANNRRLLKRTNGTGLTNIQWKIILKRYNYKCAYCGTKHNLTKDHVIPISKGGEHSPENIVPACSTCNTKKGTKLGWKPKVFKDVA